MTEARTVLDRPAIVAAVLRLVEQHGFGGITMRALATELGLSPMAVYHHIRDKKELLALANDAVVGQVVIPTEADGDWGERIITLHRRYREVHARYPGAISAQLQGGFGASGERLSRTIINWLREAGFEGRELSQAFATLHSYSYGRLWVEQAQRDHPFHTRPAADVDAFDRFRSEAADDAYDEWGLRLVVDGLRQRAGGR